jgi:hypothetical protein
MRHNWQSLSRKCKPTCRNALNRAQPCIIDAFTLLDNDAVPSPGVMMAVAECVCQLYSPKSKKTEVGELRWQFFTKSQAEAQNFPPTQAALEYHIYRAHCQSMIWCNAHVADPKIHSPDMYGWKKDGSRFVPLVTDLTPAPTALIELVRCGCGPGKCKGWKVNLTCTDMCSCDAYRDMC